MDSPAPFPRTPPRRGFLARGLRVMLIGAAIALIFSLAAPQQLGITLAYALPVTFACWLFIDGGRLPMAVDANPMAQALGMALHSVDEVRGNVELGFEPCASFLQGTGVLQGGALAGRSRYKYVQPRIERHEGGWIVSSPAS